MWCAVLRCDVLHETAPQSCVRPFCTSGVLPIKDNLQVAALKVSHLMVLLTQCLVNSRQQNALLLQALAQACVQDKVTDDIKRSIGQHVNRLVQQYSTQMQPLLSSLPSEQQTALTTFMN